MDNKKIEFEKFLSSDFDKYYQLVKDEDVMAMITEQATPLHIAQLDYRLILKKNTLDEMLGYFKVFDVGTNCFIGLGKIEIETKDATSAELGYMILPQFWRKGFASAIASKLLAIASKHEKFETLTAIIDPNNLASRKILINNDFVSMRLCEIDGLPAEIYKMNLK